jgi:3-methyladenine DNA glycosylase AlkC
MFVSLCPRPVNSSVRPKPRVGITVIVKVQDIKPLLARGRIEPEAVLPELRKLAASDQWQTREVAATALVEIGKRHPAEVLREARRWAKARDFNVRRAASEGLRGIVKLDPNAVRPVLEMLRGDPELYVKKSVANVLRNASAKHPDFVLHVCRQWARSSDPHTHWIIKDGLRKLNGSRPREVGAILDSLKGSA